MTSNPKNTSGVAEPADDWLEAFDQHARQFTYRNHVATPEHFPTGATWFEAGYRAAFAASQAASHSAPVRLATVMKAASEAFGYEGGLQTVNQGDLLRFADQLRVELAAPVGAETVAPGFVSIPKRLTRAMSRALMEEDWQWADLLAAAEVITEEEHNSLMRFASLANIEKMEDDLLAKLHEARTAQAPSTEPAQTKKIGGAE